MTGESVYPKVDGDVAYASEYNDHAKHPLPLAFRPVGSGVGSTVLECASYGFDIFFDTADLIATSTNCTRYHMGHDSGGGVTNSHLAFYRATGNPTLQTVTFGMPMTMSSAWMWLDYKILTAYDECNDSSVDAALWTSDGATEDTTGISVSADGKYFRTQGTGSNKFDSNTYICFATKEYVNAAGGQTASCTVMLTDDGSSNTENINVTSSVETETHTYYHLYEIFNDTTDKVALVYIDGQYSETVDWSTWSALRVQFSAAETGGDAIMQLYFIGTECASQSSSFTLAVSADNGSNFSTVQNRIKSVIANTGSLMAGKVTGTKDASEIPLFFRMMLYNDSLI